MKSFRFSLDSVATLRQFRKMEASEKLAAMSRLRQSAVQLLSDGMDHLRNIEEGLRMAIAPRVKAVELQMIQKALMDQRARVAELHKACLKATEKETKARHALLRAQHEYEAMLKLETRQREQHRKELEAEDEKTMQEFVSAQHVLMKGR